MNAAIRKVGRSGRQEGRKILGRKISERSLALVLALVLVLVIETDRVAAGSGR